jgi:ABC-type branched-subunit amino acid transport system substrate-binding protein
MIRKAKRATTLVSAVALSLGMVSTGLLAGNANAATATPGVTARTITIGATVPLSGIADSYAPVSAAANAVFTYINKHGGINGRTIKYTRLDDCYNIAAVDASCTAGASTTTLSQTKVLVAQDHVFATVGALGTAGQDSVRSYMKSNGVPQLFVNSGSADWDQPSTYPNLFGFQTSYVAEGKIFARYIKANFAGKTIGFIGQADDFGANGYLGLTDGGLSISSANDLSYSTDDAITGSSSDLQQDVLTLKTNGAQVVVLDSVPGFTTGILEVAHALSYSPQWIISSVGSDPSSVNTPLEAGALSLDYFPAVTDKADPWIPWVRKVLLADKTDFPTFTASSVITGNELYGAGYAIGFAETLKAEGKNVTRAGFVKTMESMTLNTPAIVPLKFSKNNHQGLLGGTIVKVAANGTAAPTTATPVGHNIYSTTNTKGSPITVGTKMDITTIPSWLK